MTSYLLGKKLAKEIAKGFPKAILEANDKAILVESDSLFDVIEYLKNEADFEFNYLNHITAVDYYQYFELTYQLTSLKHNHSVVLKTQCHNRTNPSVRSVVSLYQGADFQEREIYDLMGISFEGHPNLKRIVLWDGFDGHPLRKDYL